MGESLAPARPPARVSAPRRSTRLGDDYGSAVIRTTDAILAISEGDLSGPRRRPTRPHRSRGGSASASPSGRLAYVRGHARRPRRQPARRLPPRRAGPAADERARPAPGRHRAGPHARAARRALRRAGAGRPVAGFVDEREGVWTHYDGTVMAAAQNHAGVDARHAGDLDDAGRRTEPPATGTSTQSSTAASRSPRRASAWSPRHAVTSSPPTPTRAAPSMPPSSTTTP